MNNIFFSITQNKQLAETFTVWMFKVYLDSKNVQILLEEVMQILPMYNGFKTHVFKQL